MFKPMLAGSSATLTQLRFPVLASPKLDGVRALVVNGTVVSRNLKPIPNRYVQAMFGRREYEGLDGELMVGPWTAADVFRATTSGVMSVEGEPDVAFAAFDHFCTEGGFAQRLKRARQIGRSPGSTGVIPIAHEAIATLDELQGFEEDMLEAGYEGVMVRDPHGPYKHGRSTEREGWLLKLKRFEDSEAIIVDCYEQLRNDNAATLDELGRTKRSSHKLNKTGKGTLGGFHVRDVKTGVEFEVGTGFDDNLRAQLWYGYCTNTQNPVGQIIKYKYFPTGSKEKPRHPVFLGFRSEQDL